MARLVYDRRGQVTEMIRKRVERRLASSAREVLSGAIDTVPVRTGRLLRSSRLVRPSRLVRIVAFVIHYAGFVEFGTRRSRAKPYLMPSFWRVRAAFVTSIQDAVRVP